MGVNIEAIEEYLDGSEALFLEPRKVYDRAIIGIAEQAGGLQVLAYDAEACVQALIDEEDWSFEDAQEWFDFNVSGAYLGRGTPVFISTFSN